MRILFVVLLFTATEARAGDQVVVLAVEGGRDADLEVLRQAIADLPDVTASNLTDARHKHAEVGGCTDTECLVKDGAKAGLDWVVVAHVGKVHDRVAVVLKRIQIPTLRVQREVELVRGPSAQLPVTLPRLARRLWARPLAPAPAASLVVLYTVLTGDPVLGELFVAELAAAGSHRVIGQGDVASVVTLKDCRPPKCVPPVNGDALAVGTFVDLKIARLDERWVIRTALFEAKNLAVLKRTADIATDDAVVEVIRRAARTVLSP